MEEFIIQYLDDLGSLFVIIGVYLAGKKNWLGWAFNIGGQIIYIYIAIAYNITGLLWLNATLTLLAIKNLYYWKTGKI